VKKIALATLVAGVMALPLAPSFAQETSSATQSSQQLEWQNPERIADIQDDSERIRAYSVLIGQSVYDEMIEADSQANAAEQPEITAINIVDITEALSPEDVRSLERAAEMNEDNIRRLQSYLELEADTKAVLERENVLPADVVGIQISQGGVLDLLVVPAGLTE